MQRSWRILLTGIGLCIVVLISFSAGVWAAPAVRSLVDGPVVAAPSVGQQFQVFWQVWNLVTENYVDHSKINPQQMTYGAIRGMLATLDDPGHTRFLTSDDYRNQENHLEGRLTGIGVAIESRANQIVIQEVYPDSPASDAGIQNGDVILSVDGTAVASMTADQVANAMRGPRGSTVRLSIRHANEQTARDLTLVRADVRLVSVRWQMLPGTTIADVAISEFNQGTTDSLRTAVLAAKAQGATRFIVDVRNNPGGLLDEAVSVSSLFLPSGKVLIQRDAHKHDDVYNVQPGAIATHDPLVVLVNHGTASAAEIFAAAIQDNHRGQVIGSTTLGTGTVLSTYRLLDGSALLLGTAEWLTPDGQSLWKRGVTPDVAITAPNGSAVLLPHTLDFPTTPAQLAGGNDPVLARGMQLVQEAQGNSQ